MIKDHKKENSLAQDKTENKIEESNKAIDSLNEFFEAVIGDEKCEFCSHGITTAENYLGHISKNEKCYDAHCKKYDVKQTPELSKLHRLEVWLCGEPVTGVTAQ